MVFFTGLGYEKLNATRSTLNLLQKLRANCVHLRPKAAVSMDEEPRNRGFDKTLIINVKNFKL